MESCALCNRSDLKLTFHHLVPRKMHGKAYIEKLYPDVNLHTYGIDVCIPCHKSIHKHIEHRDLAERYATREALLEHPEIAKFVAFNRKQTKFKK